ncbi:MAG: hypothetical protein V3S41_01165, partial [Spirochaetia bacterium]
MRNLISLLLLIALQVGAFAFDVGTYFDLSNSDFARTRTVAETTLPGNDYIWGVRVTGRDELAEGLAL